MLTTKEMFQKVEESAVAKRRLVSLSKWKDTMFASENQENENQEKVVVLWLTQKEITYIKEKSMLEAASEVKKKAVKKDIIKFKKEKITALLWPSALVEILCGDAPLNESIGYYDPLGDFTMIAKAKKEYLDVYSEKVKDTYEENWVRLLYLSPESWNVVQNLCLDRKIEYKNLMSVKKKLKKQFVRKKTKQNSHGVIRIEAIDSSMGIPKVYALFNRDIMGIDEVEMGDLIYMPIEIDPCLQDRKDEALVWVYMYLLYPARTKRMAAGK